MKNITQIALTVFTVLSCTLAIGQDMNKAQADREAQQLLNQYQADLELTIEQATKFHQKISEYLIKRSEIESKSLAPQVRKSEMSRLSNQENSEMSAILNSQQLKLYKKLKPKIQPI